MSHDQGGSVAHVDDKPGKVARQSGSRRWGRGNLSSTIGSSFGMRKLLQASCKARDSSYFSAVGSDDGKAMVSFLYTFSNSLV